MGRIDCFSFVEGHQQSVCEHLVLAGVGVDCLYAELGVI